MAYVTTSEAAKIIRTALKGIGYNQTKVSVRAPSCGSIRVTIKDASVSFAKVEAIAKTQESISRDDFGDILAGGNTFVNVEYSTSDCAEALDAIAAEFPTEANRYAVVRGLTVTNEGHDTYEIRGENLPRVMRAYGARHAATQILEATA